MAAAGLYPIPESGNRTRDDQTGDAIPPMLPEHDADDFPFRTVVAAVPGAPCPAADALRMEGVRPSVVELPKRDSYAGLLAACWLDGGGFCLVEGDTCPWPGALSELWACAAPWCGLLYPLAPGVLDGGLGCVAFKPSLVAGAPDLPNAWRGHHWRGLDLTLRRAVVCAVGSRSRQGFHVHRPAAAHARSRTD